MGFNTFLYRGGCGLSRSPLHPLMPFPCVCHLPPPCVRSVGPLGPSHLLSPANPAAPRSLATGAVPPGQGPPTPTRASCLHPLLHSTALSHLLDLSNSLEWKYDQSDVAEVPPLVAHPPHFPLPSLFNDRTLSGCVLVKGWAAVLVVKYSELHLRPLVYSRPGLPFSLVPAWLLSPWTGHLGLVSQLTLRTRPVSAPGQGCML